MTTRIAAVVGCVGVFATLGPQPLDVAHAAATKPSEFATIGTLPSFGRGGVAQVAGIRNRVTDNDVVDARTITDLGTRELDPIDVPSL